MSNSYKKWLSELKIGDKCYQDSTIYTEEIEIEIFTIGRKWITTKYHGKFSKKTGISEESYSRIYQNKESYQKYESEKKERKELKEEIRQLIGKEIELGTLKQIKLALLN